MRATFIPTVLALGLAACSSSRITGSSSKPGPPARIVQFAGDRQQGTWSQPLAQPIVAVVQDSNGRGVPGVSVSFTVVDGGGALGTPTVLTDSLGRAATTWTLGDTLGFQGSSAALALPATSVEFFADAILRPLSPDSVMAYAAADFLTHSTFTVAANCGGTPTVNCPGGVPGTPIQVSVVRDSLAVATVIRGERYDITARLAVSTTQDIPLEAAGIQCGLAVNTAGGSIPTIGLTAELDFFRLVSTDSALDAVFVSNVGVTDLEGGDVSLNGGVVCGGLGAGAGFYLSTLTGVFTAGLNGMFCAPPVPGPAPIGRCPFNRAVPPIATRRY